MSLRHKQIIKTIASYVIIFGLAFACALHISEVYAISKVCGDSMDPTLQDGDILIVKKDEVPKDQDIIVLSSEGNDAFSYDNLVKRYYADLSDDDSVWVEGDNKEVSLDSRDAGTLDRDNVQGVVVFNLSSAFRKVFGK